MKKIATIKNIKVDGKNCSAVVGIVAADNSLFVLTTHAGNNKTKQPCVLHQYINILNDNKKYTTETKVLYTEKGNHNIAVHANSLAYNNGSFYVVTRNGKGGAYNQILQFNCNGRITKKYKYDKQNSCIATLSGKPWHITVNGGNKVIMRPITFTDKEVVQAGKEFKLIYDLPDGTVGNDIYISRMTDKIYTTKTEDNMRRNYIYEFDLYTHEEVYRHIVNAPKEYSKFEVEGVCREQGRLFACVNGVKDGVQDDGIWIL